MTASHVRPPLPLPLQIKTLLSKHKLRGSGASRIEAERRDVISHFILRLAYCRCAGAGTWARAGAQQCVAGLLWRKSNCEMARHSEASGALGAAPS